MDQVGIDVGFFKPLQSPNEQYLKVERSTTFLQAVSGTKDLVDPLSFEEAKHLLKVGGTSRLIQDIVEKFEEYCVTSNKNVVVVEGLQPTADIPELDTLNHLLQKAFDAEVIIVATMTNMTNGGGFQDLQDQVIRVADHYGGVSDPSVAGCIVNKFNAPASQ
jgi:phosphate acetyltransferase